MQFEKKFYQAIEESKKTMSEELKYLAELAQAYSELGIFYYKQKDLDKATKYFNQLNELYPDLSQAYVNLGNTCSGDKADEAIEYYTKAIWLDSQNADAYYNLGNVYYKQKDFDKAIECFKKALDLNPNLVNAHHNLHVLCCEQDEL